MKGIHKFFMAYVVVVTGLCIYLAFLSFGQLTKAPVNESVKAKSTETASTTETEQEEMDTFRLAVRDGHVVILKGTSIFETTSIKESEMGEALRKEVENETTFASEEEVYSFLESYTS
ncbi:MAG: hypothetical protein UHS41_07440 [Lachnospiraceae bacterium]|nr:hypothetical protein [Lachnospiraceae bacterium]